MSFQEAYIAVHGGAGKHSRANEADVKHGLKLACIEALKDSHPDGSTKGLTRLEMVTNAITALEDNPILNAGYGSNLSLDGGIQCDAAIMDGDSGDFGSVGAVPGIKNPIQLAHSILKISQISDPLGRIPPLTLVGEGAREFASQTGTVQVVPMESLITSQARDAWRKWKDRLEGAQQKDAEAISDGLMDVQDTVGAVACRYSDGVAAGVSSGGILLKYPGRVGEAAIYGAGCWAQQFKQGNIGIACSVSGTGEYIMRSMLARAVGEAFEKCILEALELDPHAIINQVLSDKLLGKRSS